MQAGLPVPMGPWVPHEQPWLGRLSTLVPYLRHSLELWSRGNRGPIGAGEAQGARRCGAGVGSTTGEPTGGARRRINDVTGTSRGQLDALTIRHENATRVSAEIQRGSAKVLDPDHDYRLITDPQHSWLEVPWTTFKAMRLTPSDFSDCSYRGPNACYLETDLDAPKFLAIYQARYKRPPHITKITDRDYCFIHHLPRNTRK
jgi:hypothetical protein